MKLSKLYSNKPVEFVPIEFQTGLNVVFAEIRLAENREKDTHNLGKSILGRLIDFTFLSKRSADFFLFKHEMLFKEFVFYLEIEIEDASFITIRRSVEQPSRISFKKHNIPKQDFVKLADSDWDHLKVPFERAREMLDSLLDLRTIKPWKYRNGLGYFIRSQDDYLDVFKLKKFRAVDAKWKPYLAHILGFNATKIQNHYKTEEKLEKKEKEAETINRELGGSIEDISKIEGMLLLKQQEADKQQKLLDSFDFRNHDKEQTKLLVDVVDEQIAALNTERYSLQQNQKKIAKSLEKEQILFNPDEAEQLFQEAGILFPEAIKKDFTQLIEFNKSITEERRAYLQEEKDEINERINAINADLNKLGKQRSVQLTFLRDTEIFEKYKHASNGMVTLRADIESLERQRAFLRRLQNLRTEIRDLKEDCNQFQEQIEKDVETQNSDKESLFSQIRLYFSEIIERVISRKALLSVAPNKKGHLQFSAEILDKTGNTTSAGSGHTYRKLLCIAFDLAVLRAHINDKFPRFVYHDGVFESLDNRKKENLLQVLHDYNDSGIQSIISLIDSDLPAREAFEPVVFDESEIVLRLHDEDASGRLFKMHSW